MTSSVIVLIARQKPIFGCPMRADRSFSCLVLLSSNPTTAVMSYVPPHLRNRPLQSIHRPAQSSSSQALIPPNSQTSPKPRDNHGLQTSRHAQTSFRTTPSRPIRLQESGTVLESNPNDIKPRRMNREDDKPGNEENAAKMLSTEMELLGTVSRSGGLGDENDA